MNILEKIIIYKHKEVELHQQALPISELEKSPYFEREVLSASQFVTNPELSGIIAEVKRKSPSKGVINANAPIGGTAKGYQEAGVSAVSVLTDREFFGGSSDFLTEARKVTNVPLLRKDFVVNEYQIIEAKAIGADFILLIAAVLTPEEIRSLASFAQSLGLEVLMEVHDRKELERSLCDELNLVGVNNRNLKNFEVSLETSEELAELIPSQFIKISESGLRQPSDIMRLKKSGYQGFLIGESFMKQANPTAACASFVREVKLLEKQEVSV